MADPKKPTEDKKDETTTKGGHSHGGCGCGHSH